MCKSQQQDIETVVRLLSEESGSTFQARYADCEAIIARYLKDGSAFLIHLIEAAVEAGVHRITLIDDAVSFLDDSDMARLATFLQDAAESDADVEELLAQAALQAPELFPDEVLADIPDFEDWQTHDDPRSPLACHHLVFEGGTPDDSPFPTHRNHPTWHLPTAGPSFAIGGEGTGLCRACGRRLVHLITLDDFGAGTTSAFPRLRIETCDGSLEPTYYAHDAAGIPTPIAPFHSNYGSAIELRRKAASVLRRRRRGGSGSRGGSAIHVKICFGWAVCHPGSRDRSVRWFPERIGK
ncbi:hypothetical protein CK228_03195 [Mesorhizobium sp. WSM4312]|uniref:hypothetical protein n=1 Tax=Mesorhizobium sp. WSM4312 TaxID=2029411 RepID=UPI000BAFD817|nr:hypothetical protein [Mesorhizobium sp. WSM4312]PBB70658.1 hypothetical protein CK228_03195 [Mesorhizobium sp. WSM4312]